MPSSFNPNPKSVRVKCDKSFQKLSRGRAKTPDGRPGEVSQVNL